MSEFAEMNIFKGDYDSSDLDDRDKLRSIVLYYRNEDERVIDAIRKFSFDHDFLIDCLANAIKSQPSEESYELTSQIIDLLTEKNIQYRGPEIFKEVLIRYIKSEGRDRVYHQLFERDILYALEDEREIVKMIGTFSENEIARLPDRVQRLYREKKEVVNSEELSDDERGRSDMNQTESDIEISDINSTTVHDSSSDRVTKESQNYSSKMTGKETSDISSSPKTAGTSSTGNDSINFDDSIDKSDGEEIGSSEIKFDSDSDLNTGSPSNNYDNTLNLSKDSFFISSSDYDKYDQTKSGSAVGLSNKPVLENRSEPLLDAEKGVSQKTYRDGGDDSSARGNVRDGSSVRSERGQDRSEHNVSNIMDDDNHSRSSHGSRKYNNEISVESNRSGRHDDKHSVGSSRSKRRDDGESVESNRSGRHDDKRSVGSSRSKRRDDGESVESSKSGRHDDERFIELSRRYGDDNFEHNVMNIMDDDNHYRSSYGGLKYNDERSVESDKRHDDNYSEHNIYNIMNDDNHSRSSHGSLKYNDERSVESGKKYDDNYSEHNIYNIMDDDNHSRSSHGSLKYNDEHSVESNRSGQRDDEHPIGSSRRYDDGRSDQSLNKDEKYSDKNSDPGSVKDALDDAVIGNSSKYLYNDSLNGYTDSNSRARFLDESLENLDDSRKSARDIEGDEYTEEKIETTDNDEDNEYTEEKIVDNIENSVTNSDKIDAEQDKGGESNLSRGVYHSERFYEVRQGPVQDTEREKSIDNDRAIMDSPVNVANLKPMTFNIEPPLEPRRKGKSQRVEDMPQFDEPKVEKIRIPPYDEDDFRSARKPNFEPREMSYQGDDCDDKRFSLKKSISKEAVQDENSVLNIHERIREIGEELNVDVGQYDGAEQIDRVTFDFPESVIQPRRIKQRDHENAQLTEQALRGRNNYGRHQYRRIGSTDTHERGAYSNIGDYDRAGRWRGQRTRYDDINDGNKGWRSSVRGNFDMFDGDRTARANRYGRRGRSYEATSAGIHNRNKSGGLHGHVDRNYSNTYGNERLYDQRRFNNPNRHRRRLFENPADIEYARECSRRLAEKEAFALRQQQEELNLLENEISDIRNSLGGLYEVEPEEIEHDSYRGGRVSTGLKGSMQDMKGGDAIGRKSPSSYNRHGSFGSDGRIGRYTVGMSDELMEGGSPETLNKKTTIGLSNVERDVHGDRVYSNANPRRQYDGRGMISGRDSGKNLDGVGYGNRSITEKHITSPSDRISDISDQNIEEEDIEPDAGVSDKASSILSKALEEESVGEKSSTVFSDGRKIADFDDSLARYGDSYEPGYRRGNEYYRRQRVFDPNERIDLSKHTGYGHKEAQKSVADASSKSGSIRSSSNMSKHATTDVKALEEEDVDDRLANTKKSDVERQTEVFLSGFEDTQSKFISNPPFDPNQPSFLLTINRLSQRLHRLVDQDRFQQLYECYFELFKKNDILHEINLEKLTFHSYINEVIDTLKDTKNYNPEYSYIIRNFVVFHKNDKHNFYKLMQARIRRLHKFINDFYERIALDTIREIFPVAYMRHGAIEFEDIRDNCFTKNKDPIIWLIKKYYPKINMDIIFDGTINV